MASFPTVLIRRARPADAAALREVIYDTHESTWFPQVTLQAVQRFRAEDPPAAYIASRLGEFRVAECDGEVVGFVNWAGDFVHALHVRSSHARMGIGRRLMDEAEAEIARAGHAKVRLETDTFNARSRAFYAARGYREMDQYPDKVWDSGLTTLLLEKALA